MRPNPHDTETEDVSGRIIYLGDVRRRRTMRQRQQPDRHYLAALALVAGVAWALWFTVLFTLQPARLLTYLAFFVPLTIALGTTGAIGVYAAEWRAGRLPVIRQAVRQSFLGAGVLVVNLAALAANRWSVLVFGLSVLVGLTLEVAARRRET